MRAPLICPAIWLNLLESKGVGGRQWLLENKLIDPYAMVGAAELAAGRLWIEGSAGIRKFKVKIARPSLLEISIPFGQLTLESCQEHLFLRCPGQLPATVLQGMVGRDDQVDDLLFRGHAIKSYETRAEFFTLIFDAARRTLE